MIYTILGVMVAGFVGFIFLKRWAIRRRRNMSRTPDASILAELKILEADLPHDFLKSARLSAEKKLNDRKKKRVEAIYLDHPELLE